MNVYHEPFHATHVALAVACAVAAFYCFNGPLTHSPWANAPIGIVGGAAHADDDGDGRVDRVVVMADDLSEATIHFDDNRDGAFDRIRNVRFDSGVVVEQRDTDFDGLLDTAADITRIWPTVTQ